MPSWEDYVVYFVVGALVGEFLAGLLYPHGFMGNALIPFIIGGLVGVIFLQFNLIRTIRRWFR